MKYFFLLTLLLGCQDFNSNTSDKTKYGPTSIDQSDLNFVKAYAIIQTRCINCHTGTHDRWASYTSTQLWIDDGTLINRGDPDNSYFIQRIKNTGTGISDMPYGASGNLPNAEYEMLKTWIREIP